jgi:hypothetical protein
MAPRPVYAPIATKNRLKIAVLPAVALVNLLALNHSRLSNMTSW